MNTFLNVIASILPGARSVRVPVSAGLLWTGFLWLLLADRIPEDPESTSAVGQIRSLSEYLGTAWTVALGSFLVFVIGALFGFAAELLSGMVGRLLSQGSPFSRVGWQRHARHGYRDLKRQRRRLRARKKLIERAGASEGATGRKEELQLVERHKSHTATVLTQTEYRVELVKRWGGWARWFWIAQNIMTESALGHRPASTEYEVAQQIIAGVFEREAAERIEGLQGGAWEPRIGPDPDFASGLVAEFQPDPIDALKALDNELWAEIDRERSERELRVAIAAPLMAISTLLSIKESGWYATGLALSLLLLIAHSRAPADERARIMKLVSLKQLETPSMRSAVVEARADVRMRWAEHQESQAQVERASRGVATGAPKVENAAASGVE